MKSSLITIFLVTLSICAHGTPPEEYAKYLEMAQEAETNEKLSEAISHYKKATEVNSKTLDKREAYVQLINLQLSSKENGKKDLARFETWLKDHSKIKEEISPWLMTVKNHLNHSPDVSTAPPMMKGWVKSHQIKKSHFSKKIQRSLGLS